MANLSRLLANAPGNPAIWKQFLLELGIQLQCERVELLVNDLTFPGRHQLLFGVSSQTASQTKLADISAEFRHLVATRPYQVSANPDPKSPDQPSIDTGPPICFGIAIPCNQSYVVTLLLSRSRPCAPSETTRIHHVLQQLLQPLESAIHGEQRHKIKNQLSHVLGHHFDSYIVVDHRLQMVFADPLDLAILQQLDCVSIEDCQLSLNNQALEQRIRAVIASNQSATFHNRCESCQINLLPTSALTNLYPWECYKAGYILVFTLNQEQNSVINRLIERYSLSKCEAVCALQFMQTPSIADIAANTFRSQETIRNHLKHAMQKMNAHSQAELMKKLITISSL